MSECPPDEIPKAILSLENLRLIRKWTVANGDGYSIRDRAWIHPIVAALIDEVTANRCLTCGGEAGRECRCPKLFTTIEGSEDLPYDDEDEPCRECGEDDCYCPNPHPPGGIPR